MSKNFKQRGPIVSFGLNLLRAFLLLILLADSRLQAQQDDHGNPLTESQIVNDANVERASRSTEHPHNDSRPDDRSSTAVDRDRYGRATEVRVKDRKGRLRRRINVTRDGDNVTTTTLDLFPDGSIERTTTTTWKRSFPGGPLEPGSAETTIYDPTTHRPKERWRDEWPGGRLWHEDWQQGWPDGTWIRRPQPGATPTSVISMRDVKIDIAGTGETIGHIADVRLTNMSKSTVKLRIPPMILESVSGKTQHYAVPGGQVVSVEPGKTETVPVEGVCLVRAKPPVGKGVTGDLVINEGRSGNVNGSAMKIASRDAQTMLRIVTATYQAAKELQKAGLLEEIPYSDPKKKQDIVVQWSTWMNPEIAELTGAPAATKKDLEKVVYKQIEQSGPVTAEKKKKIDQGINAIFEKIELTSAKAKDVEKPASADEIAPGQPSEPVEG